MLTRPPDVHKPHVVLVHLSTSVRHSLPYYALDATLRRQQWNLMLCIRTISLREDLR